MKKSLSIAFFLICIIAGLYIGSLYKNSAPSKPVSSIAKMHVVESANIAVTRTPIPTPGVPQTISIPSIHLSAPIEQVDVDSEGRMDVPKKAMDVGWYDKGFRPGAPGNAVLDGHLDLASGAPAVFWDAKKLQKGDLITVTDEQNKHYTYVVTQTTAYDFDKLPLDAIFASSSSSHLNLITCNGTWDKAAHNYSKRLVVYADLKK